MSFKEILNYLNPMTRLGKNKYSFLFPLLFSITVCIVSEIFATVILQRPNIVGTYIILVNVASLIYFSFRDGVRGGIIASIIPILYYLYIIYSRHYEGARLTSGITTSMILGILYLFIASVIGFLKQTIDKLIRSEIEARRHAEKQTTKLEAILEKQKVIEKRKDDFINMASHELKTPLTSINIYSKMIHKYLQGDEKAMKIQSKIDNQLNKLKELVSELLDATNIERGRLNLKKSKFLLRGLAEDIIDSLQGISQHELVLDWHTKHPVFADKERIRQVLINLISNAISYSPPKSKIILRSKKEDHRLVISVQDFGKGISVEDSKKIFERFYRAGEEIDKTYPGLGLGLYISHQIVTMHKGKIWVESEPGKGSTFYFSLPIVDKVKGIGSRG